MRDVTGTAKVIDGKLRIELTLVAADPPADAVAVPRSAGEVVPAASYSRVTHAETFEAVNWYGTVYTFSTKQRQVFAELWRARQQGFDWVDQHYLLELAESGCHNLRALFGQGKHPAWGVVIVPASGQDAPPGSYRLADLAAAG